MQKVVSGGSLRFSKKLDAEERLSSVLTGRKKGRGSETQLPLFPLIKHSQFQLFCFILCSFFLFLSFSKIIFTFNVYVYIFVLLDLLSLVFFKSFVWTFSSLLFALFKSLFAATTHPGKVTVMQKNWLGYIALFFQHTRTSFKRDFQHKK